MRSGPIARFAGPLNSCQENPIGDMPSLPAANHCKLAVVCWLMVAGSASGALAEDQRVAAAQTFFARYQRLERNFDPELASLYAKDSVIWVTRIYSNNVVRQLKIPGDLYRQALRESMEHAEQRGDYNEYSDVRFDPQPGGVRIRAMRYNVWRDYRSPYAALVRPGGDGNWRIVDEHFETRVPQPATE